ncbi:MAG: class I SAM-dependent methyltransferase [Spirochaetaceae bacterium]|jgi:ubiquinone/menaquinone biosynthesis C-methylase UbiE|nr:class I SAM-dependent methyltransferase [Spirochaetaceae bacterium]
MEGNEFKPFQWKYENAENLSFEDYAFDFVIIHAAIHHASSPHKVLTEMYRVARKGVLAFESRDSFLIKILEKYGMTQTYEHAAVYFNGCKYGGVNNTEIPNFIYRWTEREIEKTIQSYAPCFKHTFIYKYGYDFPCTPELEQKRTAKIIFLKIVRPLYIIFAKLFPKQQNLFAFFVEKPNATYKIFPWLKIDTAINKITFNQEWLEN